MISALILGTALAAPTLDKWEIKAPYGPKASVAWNVKVDADMGGENHEATLRLELITNDRKDGEPAKAAVTWKNLQVDGQDMGDQEPWEVRLDEKTGVLKGDDEDISRMLMALFFLYPDKAVEATDSWETKIERNATEAKMSVQVAEKLGETDVLKVVSALKETSGAAPMIANGAWWVDKAGNVHKFEVTVKKWVVPMAGGEAFDAVIKGELVKK